MTIREILDLHPEVQGEERAQILCRDEIGILGCCFHGPYDNNPKKYREALFETIRSGEVRMTIIQLPEPIPRWQRFTGHEKHQRSCGSVAAWIESIGREWDKSTGTGEVYSKAGSRADLQTVDGKLTVEVGLTKVDGVMQCLELGVEVLLVPHRNLGAETPPFREGRKRRAPAPPGLTSPKMSATLPAGGDESQVDARHKFAAPKQPWKPR